MNSDIRIGSGRQGIILRLTAWLCAAVALASATRSSCAQGMTPESPEVQKLVNSALTYLETHGDDRLGGKCLFGLAFFKAGRIDHPRVKEALAACAATIRSNPPDSVLDIYSNGLAIIFLCEVSPEKNARDIEWYLGRLKKRQKAHGGWGYHDLPSGDTSQSQYAALSYWEANRHGFAIEGGSVDNLAEWLMKTQGPGGCWGYQGQISETGKPMEQDEENCSMLAAGLGSLYICADLFGMRTVAAQEAGTKPEDELPPALRPVGGAGTSNGPKTLRPTKTVPAKVISTMAHAHTWMAKNYKIDIGEKRYYYLYGLERYKSFQEVFDRTDDKSPPWYNDGFAFLAKTQAADGSWVGYCGAECDTAFATLFLLRSTQKSIQAKLGEGLLLAGRGLPTNLAKAKMRNGQLIVEQTHTRVDELLSMIDDDSEGALDDLARDPSQLVIEKVDENSARRLQQLVHGGATEARLLAVRALGRTGNLDYVPTLLYALTDPEREVVIEARNELRFISRNFNGLGPPDEFTDPQRYEAIDAWKKWYLSIRPDAVLEK